MIDTLYFDFDHEHEHEKINMIARIWHGWTKPVDAKAYEKLLHDEIFPSIAARKIEGYRGAELFVHEDGDEVEFVTLLRFDSMNAVKEFAGADANKVFVLVYNLHDSQDLFKRFPAGEGHAYFVGGFSAQYMRQGDIVLIPIRLGVGLRLGINAGYMRFSERNRWLPF